MTATAEVAEQSKELRPPGSDPARFGPWRRELRSFLELLALAGVAVAQPTFDILSKNADTFVTRGTTPFQAVLFAVLVVLVPPAAAWMVEVAAGAAVPKARRYVHALLCGLAAGVIAVEVLKKQSPLTSSRLVIGGIIAGLAVAALVWRFEVVRLWLRYLAFASAAFAVMFLFFSPVTSVVFREPPASASGVEVGKPSRVVAIVLDEFPLMSLLDGNGRVDAELFPHFAELAGTSTWYRNTTTVAPNTNAAVPAILSGDVPEPGTAPVAAEYPDNLFTLLGGAYEMNVQERVTRLCPEEVCDNPRNASTRSDLGGLIDDAWLVWRQFASPTDKDATIDLALGQGPIGDEELEVGADFVASLEPTSKPRLDYLHLLMPHEPWHYLPSGQDNTEIERASRGMGFFIWSSDETAALGRQRYLFNLQATDRFLGDVIAKLKRIGAWDDSLVVVTADHGFAFTAANPIRGASAANYPEIMWVPLFVKEPAQTAARVDDRPVLSVDVVPTIADIIDADLPFGTDGRSALREPRPDGPRPLIDWRLNTAEPEPGTDILEFDGPAGFAKMLQGARAPAQGDPALRLYKIGEYADLLGQPVAPLVDASADSPPGSILTEEHFDDVDPDARKIPWQYVEGKVEGQPYQQPLLIAVNGRVATFSWVQRASLVTNGYFWASLPPQIMKRGRNDVRLYLIEGSPAAPRLVPVDLED